MRRGLSGRRKITAKKKTAPKGAVFFFMMKKL
jgi:hypothetical protein